MQALLKQFEKHPVIPAARSPESVKRAADSNAAVIFLLGGSILIVIGIEIFLTGILGA